MTGAVKNTENSREKSTQNECPYRLISFSDGVLCFDPWLAEYVKPSEQVIDKWCRLDFRSCPNLLAYEKDLRARMQMD